MTLGNDVQPWPTRATAPRARRGIVCVVAMLFIVMFAVLAVGFYAATSMAMQLSANERAVSTSQTAAESGMQFMRYQLATLDVPPEVPPESLLAEVAAELRAKMNGTANLAGRSVGYDGSKITIPDNAAAYVRLVNGGAGFRVTITQTGERLRVKVTGTPGAATSALARALETEYELVNRPSPVFNYGVASKGKVQFKNTPTTKLTGTPDAAASVLATFGGSPSIVTGKGEIEGDLSVVADKSQVSLGAGAVGGAATVADILAGHVHVVRAPDFPYVHTTVFRPYATNTYVSGAAFQKNIRVPANANPTFNGGDVIEGILYVESPNVVRFSGNAAINGVIVFENAGDVTKNALDFKGNVSPGSIPNTSEYTALRKRAAGLAIAAPTASVTMSGSVDGHVDGTVIGAKIWLSGSADLTINRGSLISLGPDPTLIEGKTVQFNGDGADNAPYAGVRFRAYFKPDATTYREVAP